MEISWLKKHKIIALIILVVAGVVLYFAGIGIIQSSKGVYQFVSEKYKNNVRISFGRDMVVQDGVGGPYPDDSEEEIITPFGSYFIEEGAKIPYVSAKYFLVGDIESGEVIFSRGEDKSVPIASVTKLMTAVIADEKIGLEKETVVSSRALQATGEQGNLRRGEKYTIEHLLYPLLLESSNDAAEVISEFSDRDLFLADMNERAKLLKMKDTFYNDPSGLSSKNVSSVKDLFTLVQYISKYRNFIFEITQEKSFRLGNKVWFSNSRFKNQSNYLGGKNGYISAAGKTNIALFEIGFEGYSRSTKRKVAIIILNTKDIEKDTRAILSFLQKNVQYE